MNEPIKKIVKSYFNDDDGKPFEITDGQVEIFNSIFLKEYRRVQTIAPTQYGKSTIVAMALILRSQTFGEKWAIVTGSQPKSDIIMEKVIQHVFDDPRLYTELDIDDTQLLDRLRRERSKKHLTWRCGGGIRTFTADSRNRQRVKEALMGFGSPHIVEDESALIPDDLQSTILRMLGGYAGGHLIKIGNPFYRNHFLRSWESDKYHKIFIDFEQGLKEERYTGEFIEEMRDEAFFDILYECKFPQEDEIDIDGYTRLLKDAEVDRAKEVRGHEGVLRLGFDVGEGGDLNVGILRSRTYAEIVHTSRIKDLMATAKFITDLIQKYKLKPELVFIDATGIGSGVVARLHEMDYDVTGVKWGERADDKTFANKKAENYWKTRTWVIDNGKVEPRDEFNQLKLIRFKKDTGGRVKIKSKEDMKKEGIKSPDFADALAFTFGESLEDIAPSVRMI